MMPAAVLPLVSCIMPTTGARRRFVPHAIRLFFSQKYPAKQLIIVDSAGADTVADLVPDDARVRYVAAAAATSLGEKRNIGARESSGELIAHWDDDDWSDPWRLSYQIEEMQRQSAVICGFNPLRYHQPETGRSWEYSYPARSGFRWVAGNTLLYKRAVWEAAPFDDVNDGSEDLRFMKAHQVEHPWAVLDGSHGYFVAMIHGGNVQPKRTADRFWRSVPEEATMIAMGEDFAIYRGLCRYPMLPG